MINTAEILKALRDRRFADGMTQQAISKKSGVSQSYICDLLNGRRAIDSISLRTLIALFPEATLHLHGDVSIINSQNNGNVVAVNQGSANVNCQQETFNKILKAAELSAEEKVKVLTVLQK